MWLKSVNSTETNWMSRTDSKLLVAEPERFLTQRFNVLNWSHNQDTFELLAYNLLRLSGLCQITIYLSLRIDDRKI